jgi:hypothetical protein
MLLRLSSKGMNGSLTDSESPERVLRPCRQRWLAPEVFPILEALDELGKRAKARRLKTRKGNRPLPVTGLQRVIIVDGTPVPYLPRNWYHIGWYATLDSFQKTDLMAADVKDLPDIVSLDAIKLFINAHVPVERNS